jgi:hypothetical protein
MSQSDLLFKNISMQTHGKYLEGELTLMRMKEDQEEYLKSIRESQLKQESRNNEKCARKLSSPNKELQC